MPRQPLILRVHFYHAGGSRTQSLASAAQHLTYMGSVDKPELLVQAEDSRTSLASAARHARYAGERAGSLGYCGNVDADTAADHIPQVSGPVWRVILSVGEADALAMGGGLTTQAGWNAAAQKAVPAMVRRLGLHPGRVEWIAAAHRYQTHEHNPHLHLLFWETGTPQRLTMAWTASELHDVRRVWAAELYAPELAVLGAAKTAARQTAVETVKQLVGPLQGTARGSSLAQGFLQELSERLDHLGTQLPGHGRLAYAYMPADIQQAVRDLAQWLITHDDSLRAAFAHYVDQAEQFGMVHAALPGTTDWGGPDHAAARAVTAQTVRDRAARDLLERLAAPILRAASQTIPADDLGGTASPPLRRGGVLPAPAGALIREWQWALKRAAWAGRMAAYQQAAAQWQRQQAEWRKARTMGIHIEL